MDGLWSRAHSVAGHSPGALPNNTGKHRKGRGEESTLCEAHSVHIAYFSLMDLHGRHSSGHAAKETETSGGTNSFAKVTHFGRGKSSHWWVPALFLHCVSENWPNFHKSFVFKSEVGPGPLTVLHQRARVLIHQGTCSPTGAQR